MMRRPVRSFALLSLCVIGGCKASEPFVPCDLLLLPAMDVTILDSVSRQPRAVGATVNWSRDGGIDAGGAVPVDTARGIVGIYGGPGTYVVTISKSGFATWARSGIVVPRDPINRCHPAMTYLTALLQPVPQ